MTYTQTDEILRLVLQIAMPRALRLSACPKIRQRHYRAILAHGPGPSLDARDPRWTSQRAVGSLEYLKRHGGLRGRRGIVSLPEQIEKVRG